MNKNEAILFAKEADLEKSEWVDELIDSLKRTYPYAAGYLTCKVSQLNESLSWDDEEFREEIISTLESSIWK